MLSAFSSAFSDVPPPNAPPPLSPPPPPEYFLITFLLALAGGFFNGTFPVFIKTDKVLRARIHPIIFQLYKSTWVFLFGCCVLIVRLARHQPIVFTPWAFYSAAAWIPSGLFTIIAVPVIGVGASVLTTAAIGSSLSFLVFWLGFHEEMKLHRIGAHVYVLAPYFMIGVLLGMAGLVLSHQASLRIAERARLIQAAGSSDEDASSGGTTHERRLLPEDDKGYKSKGASVRRMLFGYSSAAVSGVFSALQYGLLVAGHKAEGGLKHDERFNPLGSWLFFFGTSALLCTLAAWLVLAIANRARGLPVPTAQIRVMWFPGSGAGICWSLANCFTSFAMLRGGAAVTTAQLNAAGLITSGTWGLLWYREIKGKPALAWIAAAAFTAAMAVLLGQEKS